METIKYEVVDSQTFKIMGTYNSLKKARNRADKLDLVYGAIHYFIRRAKETI